MRVVLAMALLITATGAQAGKSSFEESWSKQVKQLKKLLEEKKQEKK